MIINNFDEMKCVLKFKANIYDYNKWTKIGILVDKGK
jgi:hypothetical protein